MTRITITRDSGTGYGCCYRICGLPLRVNGPVDALSAFRSSHEHVKPESDLPRSTCIDSGRLIFKGLSWLAADDREVACYCDDSGYVIEIADAANFQVNSSGSHIRQFDNQPGVDCGISDDQLEELLLGPPLMLALALNRRFALHASSVVMDNKAVLFVGDSGFGKSTMALWLDEAKNLTRMTDDISVISDTPAGHRLLSDFPQLKLGENQQHANAEPKMISAVVALKRDRSKTPRLARLDPMESIAVLVNHSVATQLFDKPLASRHLKFMADLASTTPVYRLEFPSGRKYIEDIDALLRQQLN